MAKAFQKFIRQEPKGAKLKEKIRQEKKEARKQKAEYFAEKKRAWKASSSQAPGAVGRQSVTPSHSKSVVRRDDHQSKNSIIQKAQAEVKKEGRIDFERKRAEKKSDVTKREPQAVIQKPGALSKDNTKPRQPVNTPTQSTASPAIKSTTSQNAIPLNKFIAHAGICSRRDAVDIVKSGKVVVNGQTITEPGFKVTTKDEVKVSGKQISVRKNLVYILLNKPKDFLTTTDDPQGRKTVMDIVRNATPERVYPIGRLDRNTTGVLLLTNDGELAQKLSHPSYQVKKIYEVKLDRPLQKKDFDAIVNGVDLEDGFIAPDVLAYADTKDKSIVGIEIHSGRNRIVRRIFEKMGYDVRNLDRVMYANLTKKNVERGKWRFLSEKEVRLLKFMNASFAKNKAAK